MISVLKELGKIAEHASLTGSFEDGGPTLARKYNAVLKTAVEAQLVNKGMFAELDSKVSLSEVGIESKILAASLESRVKSGKAPAADPSLLVRLAPFVESEDLTELIRKQIATGTSISSDVIASIAPFVESRALGDLLRAASEPSSAAPVPSRAPEPPKPPTVEESMQIPEGAAPYSQRTKEELIALLDNPHLSREQKLEVAMELAYHADHQSELAD